MSRRAWAACFVVGLVVAPLPASAQVIPPFEASGGRDAPEWLSRWSPLAEIGDLPRRLPGSEISFPRLLELPAPQLGLFWVTGNPAALRREIDDTYAGAEFAVRDASGAYRRPLDPSSETRVQVKGLGWRPLGARGAVIGRVAADLHSIGDSAFAGSRLPYSSNPFTVMDTLGDPTDRLAAQVEGAGGWQFGRVGVGVAFGYAAQDIQADSVDVARQYRTGVPGVTAGLTYDLGPSVRIGAIGRWRQVTHTPTLFALRAEGRAYAPNGYEEPTAFNFFLGRFERRLIRTAWAAGLALAGQTGGMEWVLYGQRESLSEDRFQNRVNDPLVDDWNADGWTLGLAGQLHPHPKLLLSLDGRYTTLDGGAQRGDLDFIHFVSDERRLRLDADARWSPSRAWQLALLVGTTFESRLRTDVIEEQFSDIQSWEPSIAAEVARQVSDRVAVSVAGAASWYGPTSSLPDPTAIGPAYARWLAPELGLNATDATSWAGRATLRVRAGQSTHVWIRGGYGSTSPDEGPTFSDSPTGERNAWSLMFGVALDQP